MVLKCFSVRYVVDHIWQLHQNGISGPLWIVVFWISGLLTCSVMKMLIPFHWTGNLVYISKFDFILTFSFSFWFENVEIFFLFLLSICMLKYVRPRDVWCCFLLSFMRYFAWLHSWNVWQESLWDHSKCHGIHLAKRLLCVWSLIFK